jgi:hypothetical protein
MVTLHHPLRAGWDWPGLALGPLSLPYAVMACAAALVCAGWVLAIARDSRFGLARWWERAIGALAGDGRVGATYALLLRPSVYLAAITVLLALWPHQTVTFIYFRF